MRRLLMLTLSCFSILSLTACGDNKNAATQNDKMSPMAGTLDKMHETMNTMNDTSKRMNDTITKMNDTMGNMNNSLNKNKP